jgi:UDP-glucose 4-epimerase
MSTEEGKTVLLVGAGFLGKHFARDWLLTNPANKLIVLDKIDSSAFFSHPLMQDYKDDNRITYLWGNSGDPEQIEPYLKDIDDIVYTAAIADVPYAAKNPRDTRRINVENTDTFMKFLCKKFKGRIVLMSSESVYKKKECLPVKDFPPEKIAFKETDQVGPHSEYGQSKLKQEEVAREVAKVCKLRLVVIRSATMYGMYARIKQVIPDYIRQLLETQNIAIMGPGDATSRDFINVMDTVSGIKAILAAPKSIDGETFNIGTGRETFLLNLANAIKHVCGQPTDAYDPKTGTPHPKFKPIKHLPVREGEQGARIVLDISKAKEKLKMVDKFGKLVPWEPEIDLYYGLRNMIYWMATQVGYDEDELAEIHSILYPEKYKGRTTENPRGNRVAL